VIAPLVVVRCQIEEPTIKAVVTIPQRERKTQRVTGRIEGVAVHNMNKYHDLRRHRQVNENSV
jgi:hypothetical protein